MRGQHGEMHDSRDSQKSEPKLTVLSGTQILIGQLENEPNTNIQSNGVTISISVLSTSRGEETRISHFPFLWHDEDDVILAFTHSFGASR
jgi:uncharacterized protein YcfL